MDQFFTVGIREYVQSKLGIWLSDSPISYPESAIFLASHARHPSHICNLDMKRDLLFGRLSNGLKGLLSDMIQSLGVRGATYRANPADALFDVAHGMLTGDIPGVGTLRNTEPAPPSGWERRFAVQNWFSKNSLTYCRNSGIIYEMCE